MLLVLAVTGCTICLRGWRLGVGFGLGRTRPLVLRFERARNLAIGIGLQNFSEGFAVSDAAVPTRRALWKVRFLRPAQRHVEPLGGFLGAWAVVHVEPACLPYAVGVCFRLQLILRRCGQFGARNRTQRQSVCRQLGLHWWASWHMMVMDHRHC